jgi:hypothetical protein
MIILNLLSSLLSNSIALAIDTYDLPTPAAPDIIISLPLIAMIKSFVF